MARGDSSIPGLYETAAIDSPTKMLAVTEDQLATRGITLDELLDTARMNLREISQDPFTEVAPGIWAAPWQDSYDAARLALPEVLQRVCTDPLVAAPTRDLLFVADRPVSIQRMACGEGQADRVNGTDLMINDPTAWNPSTSQVSARLRGSGASDRRAQGDALEAFGPLVGALDRPREGRTTTFAVLPCRPS